MTSKLSKRGKECVQTAPFIIISLYHDDDWDSTIIIAYTFLENTDIRHGLISQDSNNVKQIYPAFQTFTHCLPFKREFRT